MLVKELEALAEDRSAMSRADLLHRVTDVYFRRPPTPDGVVAATLYEEIVLQLLPTVGPVARAGLSGRLATAPSAPPRVVRRLAEDEPWIAEPLLRHSPALCDGDLADIADRHGPAHLGPIASRVYVAPGVSDVLVARGDASVRRVVAANGGAQITASTFERLLQSARRDPLLQDILALRPNLPEEIDAATLGRLPERLRRRWQVRAAADAGDHHRLADDKAYRSLRDMLDDGVVTLDEALQEACRCDRHDWWVDLFATAGSLGRSLVRHILFDGEPRPVAVLLKMQGLSTATFRDTIELRTKHLRIGSNDPRLVSEYDRLQIFTQRGSAGLDGAAFA